MASKDHETSTPGGRQGVGFPVIPEHCIGFEGLNPYCIAGDGVALLWMLKSIWKGILSLAGHFKRIMS